MKILGASEYYADLRYHLQMGVFTATSCKIPNNLISAVADILNDPIKALIS